MLNHELLLISKLIETKDFSTIERSKITESSFITPEAKHAFKYLRKYYINPNTAGHIPSPETFLSHFSGFPLYTDISDSMEVLCHEIKTKQLRRELQQVAESLLLYADSDPYAGYNFFRDQSINLTSNYEVNNDLLLSASVDEIKERYLKAKESKGILGIPWPWHRLNEVTGGMQKGHIIYVRAKTKTGKTMNMVAAAAHAYKYYNARVLVFSLEMNNIQINNLAACYIAGIDIGLVKSGKLNPADEQRFFETLAKLKEWETQSGDSSLRSKAWLTTSGEGSTGISALKAKIIEFDPDIVIIDGVYLLYDEKSKRSDSDWKPIVNISRSLKSMQKELKTRQPLRDFCLIGIVQSDKDDEIALAKYIKQDCDISILLQGFYDEHQRKTIRWEVDAIREGEPGEGYINYLPGLDYSEREPPQIQPEQSSQRQNNIKRSPRQAVIPQVPTFGFQQPFGIR